MSPSKSQASPTATPIWMMKSKATPAQGSFDSAGAGVTGGYTGDSLDLKIIIAFLIGLALYNAVELIVLILVTFNNYRGLYFWSLIFSAIGILPYALGFLIKFFQLLDPNKSVGYVAVVMIVVGWYMMVTGQSVVLWSRLHLITNSHRVIRYCLYMICIDVVILGFPTSVLTFGSNSNSLSTEALSHFVKGYNVMEKIQMVGFFLQELVLSLIYIKETLRILKLSKNTQGDLMSIADDSEFMHPFARKIMYQLLAINTIIITMDVALLAVEFANLYLIETTLKGVVYSVKLKLEFAVLGKLVQIVRSKSNSSKHQGSVDGRTIATSMEHHYIQTARCGSGNVFTRGTWRGDTIVRMQSFPDFVDPARVSCDLTHAPTSMPPNRTPGGPSVSENEEELGWEVGGQHRKRRYRAERTSWIDEEMDKHNIG
ncbi:uncharacterized protein CC84DRAFT_1169851 [Paraphaeosphaeria sporulosa]|uniref:DUF7703 domain-containing protein n=1 Tax=Paraphaeosphaeria sporulosa TaxID=1460663 RepID=A0A177BTG2_9PLEO|nr:uncharacterized protein CC84DRAFT_1169851 [Paraphaeosphaeria sporulosa]OAF98683.1 hypothetical protein CC84DRAFT_1169851 [Paraphaeosphaeria sporulosa]